MKRSVLLPLVLLFASYYAGAQQVGIGTDYPDANAIVEIKTSAKGLLIPRMTTAQRNTGMPAMGAAQEGMLIYNLSDTEFNYWDGTMWIPFPGGLDDDWYDDSTPAQVPDDINDNIYTNGNVGIGAPSPLNSLHIADVSNAIQSIRVEDLANGGDAYNPSTATVSLTNRATVFVDRTTGIMYSEDANRAYWRLDGNSGVVNAGYSGNCPNLIATSMNASGYEYIGTNDNTDFIIATNDRERMRVLRDGQMVFYGKGIAVPASSPTGCVPAYPVIDVASFYGTGDTYPLNAYSENVPAVYGAAWDQSSGSGEPMGVRGVIEDYGAGTEGFSANATSGNSVGVSCVETSLNGWALVTYGDAICLGTAVGFSDERLKQDHGRLESGLELLMQLEPHTFEYLPKYREYGFAQGLQYGFMAQDVKNVVPELVFEKSLRAPSADKASGKQRLSDLEEFYTLNQTGLIPILTRSIQEQQGMIESQAAQIAALTEQVAALQAQGSAGR